MNINITILLAIVFLTSCNSKKEDEIVCQEPSFHCSHLEGCKAEYWCQNPAQNNGNWQVLESNCEVDGKLAGFCQSQGFPCVERKCVPASVNCQIDTDCPDLGVCDAERHQCVENCVCYRTVEWMEAQFGCSWYVDCVDEGDCGTGFLCDLDSHKCVPGYCGNPDLDSLGLNCPRGTYCLMEPAITHFCQPWFTTDPVGRCTASSTCETAADCLDPLLPVCDGSGTCVP